MATAPLWLYYQILSKWGHLPLLQLRPFKMQGQIPCVSPKEHGLGGIGENMSVGLFEPFTFFSC